MLIAAAPIVALVAAGWAAEVEGCSCVRDPVLVLPQDGSTSVPTNVAFVFAPEVETNIELRRAGTLVETFRVASPIHRVAPAMPLAPNTAYVLDEVGGRASRVSFTTGVGPDTTPPKVEDFDFIPSGSAGPCGRVESVAFTPKGAADDATPSDQLHFDFFFGATAQTVDLRNSRALLEPPPILAEGGCYLTNFPLLSTPRVAGAIAAVDWAGNRSAPTQVRVLKGCGCSTSALAVPVAGLAILLFRRRRRA